MSEEILKRIKVYEGDTGSLKQGKVKKEIDSFGWNKHLFAPLVSGEIVYLHPDQENVPERYAKIIHSIHNCVSVFSKTYFEF